MDGWTGRLVEQADEQCTGPSTYAGEYKIDEQMFICLAV